MSEEIENALKCLEMDMLDNIQIELILNYIERLQKELEEKTTILMAGADKVKQLEKENAELEFKLLARERGEAEFEVLVDTLKKENQELKDINVELNTYACAWKTTAKELKKDISNMYDKEVVISVMCDNFDVTRIEALEMLGEEE